MVDVVVPLIDTVLVDHKLAIGKLEAEPDIIIEGRNKEFEVRSLTWPNW